MGKNVNDIDEDNNANNDMEEFVPSKGLSSEAANRLLAEWGRNELEEKKIPKWRIFLNQLIEPMPIMIWIAAIVEASIQNWPDMGILLFILFANASLSYYETTKAGDAVAALKAQLRPKAYCKRDGKFTTIDATLLVPGDLVLLGSGSAVPADCIINDGQIDVDQAALTGESLPVTKFEKDKAIMGSTVVRGEVEATVSETGKHTFFGKTASLLGDTGEISNLQKLLVQITFILTSISITLCLITFIYLLAGKNAFKECLSFVVVLIVASIPVAIEIVCTTTLALGSKELSKDGAIVSRLAAIEDMAGMNMLCSDKTGTLTKNKMEIQDETPTFTENINQANLLLFAAMAAKWLEPPRDALDTLVLGSADLQKLEQVQQIDYMPFDPTVKRTEGTVRYPDGSQFKVTKGAPNIILQLIEDSSIEEKVEREVKSLSSRGIRSIAVARTDAEGKWHMLGLLTFLDPPREDTKATIDKAQEFGIEVKMITGDHLLIARETARVLGMGLNIKEETGLPKLLEDGKAPENLLDWAEDIKSANGFAQVFPEHKYLIVECLRRCGFKVGMTGDGVNDAPALKRADVGVAVSGSTDAARAAADIVLTKAGLSTIVTGILVSRKIFVRMKNFITYRIAATLQLLIFFFIACFAFKPNEEFVGENYDPSTGIETIDFDGNANYQYAVPKFFSMPVIMLMLITLLNDGTLISIGYDNVRPSPFPERWNLKVLFTYSIVLGMVSCISSLLLVDFALHGGFQKTFHYNDFTYGKLTTIVYLKVSVSDFLTLFSARTLDAPFYSLKPSKILLIAGGFSLFISTMLAAFWPKAKLDNTILAEGCGSMIFIVWAYCLICWFIQDTLKLLADYIMKKYNIFDCKNDALALSDNLDFSKIPNAQSFTEGKKEKNQLKQNLLSDAA